MKDYKKLGLKAFKDRNFDLAKTYFSLTNETSEEIMFLVGLCETAKYNLEESDMLFDYYLFSISENKLNFSELNEILQDIEEQTFDDIYEETWMENSIAYEEFKNIILDKVNFKDGLTGVMTSTKLVLRNSDNFLDFIENLLDNGLVDAGIKYFETFLEIHGSSSLKTKNIIEKIKNYEDRNKR